MTISGIPTAGLAAMSTKLGSTLWVAVGTGTGDFTDDETTMYTELVRVAVVTYRASDSQLQLEAALTSTQGVGTLTEIGVFDAASGGSMWAHYPISPSDVKPNTEGRVYLVQIPIGRQT